MKEIIVSEKAWKQKNVSTKYLISRSLTECSPQIITIDYEFVCKNQCLDQCKDSFDFIDLELKGETYNEKITSIICGETDLGDHSILTVDLSYCPIDIIPQMMREIIVSLADHDKMIAALVIICSERQFCQHLFEITSVFRILPLELSPKDLHYIVHRQKALAFRAKYREIFLPIWGIKSCLRNCIARVKHLIK